MNKPEIKAPWYADRILELDAVLEAVRSQMCWERDRDELTMGMSDLHDDVTRVLAREAIAPDAESEPK